MSIQKTIVLTYEGKKIVSKPFNFGIATMIDDEQHRYFRHARREMDEINEDIIDDDGKNSKKDKEIIEALPDTQIFYKALVKMFEGTELTEEILDNEISHKELRGAIKKIQDMYYEVDEEVKNS
jgi:hypothetical protein